MLEYSYNDRIFVTYICPYIWIISSVFVVVFQGIIGIKAPYGRYNNSNSGIPGRLAWFIQESPCFIIPCYLLYQHWSSVSITKFLLMTFFLIHYFQRYFSVIKNIFIINFCKSLHISNVNPRWKT
jgi:hypothetical protein